MSPCRCIDCTNIKTHAGGKAMFKQGFSGCSLRRVWEYHSMTMNRECKDFLQAGKSAMEARRGLA